jgi:hypothetical protein
MFIVHFGRDQELKFPIPYNALYTHAYNFTYVCSYMHTKCCINPVLIFACMYAGKGWSNKYEFRPHFFPRINFFSVGAHGGASARFFPRINFFSGCRIASAGEPRTRRIKRGSARVGPQSFNAADTMRKSRTLLHALVLALLTVCM